MDKPIQHPFLITSPKTSVGQLRLPVRLTRPEGNGHEELDLNRPFDRTTQRLYERCTNGDAQRPDCSISLRSRARNDDTKRNGSALRATKRASLLTKVKIDFQRRLFSAFLSGAFVFSGLPGHADNQTIAPGAPLTPAQIGHAFDTGCFAGVPTLIERQAELFATAFFFAPTNLGTDAAYVSFDEAITVIVDGNPIDTICEMRVSRDLAGDGAALYDSIVTHLEVRLGAEPSADYIDGGVRWSWKGENASFSYTYSEAADGFTLLLRLES